MDLKGPGGVVRTFQRRKKRGHSSEGGTQACLGDSHWNKTPQSWLDGSLDSSTTALHAIIL